MMERTDCGKASERSLRAPRAAGSRVDQQPQTSNLSPLRKSATRFFVRSLVVLCKTFVNFVRCHGQYFFLAHCLVSFGYPVYGNN